MDQRTIPMLFALLRSAVRGTTLTDEEKSSFSVDLLRELMKISAKHDIVHLISFSLKQNNLIPQGNDDVEKFLFQAVYRYEKLNYEYQKLCAALEEAKIPFIPLKGSVIRQYYPQEWMRTSCDIDILVHRENLDMAVACLSKNLQYTEKGRGTHDISLFSSTGVHVELHFDLVEEGRANSAINILRSVWENVSLRKKSEYWYEMSDAFFYFYHIAHMAKHFESGGCGIRPFIDLWILDNIKNANVSNRNKLLAQGGLLKFAEASRTLSRVWLDGEKQTEFSLQMQRFLLHGGVYGSADNRVALQQKKNGGQVGYLLSRIFISYEKLKRYYPILEKHCWLTPVMQIRRWFMLLNPAVARMAKKELSVNANLKESKAEKMNKFLSDIGLI